MQFMVGNLRPVSHPIKRVVMPRISFIVARSVPGNIIGCENHLPWQLRDDLQNFKRVTQGHVVVMGRKTLDSIGKPLPNRINIVLSRTGSELTAGVQHATTLQNAMFFADYASILSSKSEYFVIGGAEIYRVFEGFFDKIYLTEVYTGNINGDATFDYKFDKRSWKLESETDFSKNDRNEYPFRVSVFCRRDKRVRKINISEYMTDANQFIDFVTNSTKKNGSLLDRPKELISDLFNDYAAHHFE